MIKTSDIQTIVKIAKELDNSGSHRIALALDSIAEAIRSMDSVVHTSFDAITSLSKISCCDSEDTSLKYKSLETLIEDIDTIRGSIRAMAAQANVERNQAVLNMAGDLDQNTYGVAYYLLSSHLK
jgi:DNA-binding ferritin-like protein